MLSIKVLGGGCKNCHRLEDRAKEVVKEMNIDAKVELITDKEVILSYGIAMTPALVVNDNVVSSGKVLTKDKIVKILKTKV